MSLYMQIFSDIYVRIIFIHSFQSLKHPILWTTDTAIRVVFFRN